MNPNFPRNGYGGRPPHMGGAYGQPQGYGYMPGPDGAAEMYGEQRYEGALSDPAVIAFAKRVYGYFTGALLTATLACLGGMELTHYLVANGQAGSLRAVSIGTLVVFFVSYLIVVFTRKAHSPLKTALLFVFAGSAGMMIAPTITAFVAAGYTMTVLFALGITTVTFFGLTVYTLTTGKDFRSLGGILTVGLLILLGMILMGIFLPFNGLHLAISLGGIVLFTGFILYDTSRVTRDYFYAGDAVSAAIQLFYNFFMLFWYLLRLLADRR